MAAGRHQAPRPQRSGRRASKLGLVLSVILIFALSVGGTLAYIVTQTGDVTNSFAPSSVTCQVNSDCSVTNTGDIPAYIRASYAVNWVDGSGNIRGVPPAYGVNYTIGTGSNWTYNEADGFYYYLSPVAVNAAVNAPVTLGQGTDSSVPAGYSLRLTVVAEAIQADGDTDGDANTAAGIPAWENAWLGRVN